MWRLTVTGITRPCEGWLWRESPGHVKADCDGNHQAMWRLTVTGITRPCEGWLWRESPGHVKADCHGNHQAMWRLTVTGITRPCEGWLWRESPGHVKADCDGNHQAMWRLTVTGITRPCEGWLTGITRPCEGWLWRESPGHVKADCDGNHQAMWRLTDGNHQAMWRLTDGNHQAMWRLTVTGITRPCEGWLWRESPGHVKADCDGNHQAMWRLTVTGITRPCEGWLTGITRPCEGWLTGITRPCEGWLWRESPGHVKADCDGNHQAMWRLTVTGITRPCEGWLWRESPGHVKADCDGNHQAMWRLTVMGITRPCEGWLWRESPGHVKADCDGNHQAMWRLTDGNHQAMWRLTDGNHQAMWRLTVTGITRPCEGWRLTVTGLTLWRPCKVRTHITHLILFLYVLTNTITTGQLQIVPSNNLVLCVYLSGYNIVFYMLLTFPSPRLSLINALQCPLSWDSLFQLPYSRSIHEWIHTCWAIRAWARVWQRTQNHVVIYTSSWSCIFPTPYFLRHTHLLSVPTTTPTRRVLEGGPCRRFHYTGRGTFHTVSANTGGAVTWSSNHPRDSVDESQSRSPYNMLATNYCS